MAVSFGNVTYLLGRPHQVGGSGHDECIGSVFVPEHDQTCPVYQNEKGDLWLAYKPRGSSVWHARFMRTQSELLEGWS